LTSPVSSAADRLGELMLRRGAQPGAYFAQGYSWWARARNCPPCKCTSWS